MEASSAKLYEPRAKGWTSTEVHQTVVKDWQFFRFPKIAALTSGVAIFYLSMMSKLSYVTNDLLDVCHFVC
jgi:hypothetical protein